MLFCAIRVIYVLPNKERRVHIMKNEIRFTLESKQRPKLAQEIGNLLGTAPHYERVPSCAYDIAGYRLDKEGVLHIPDAEVSPSGKGIHIIGQCDITKLPVHFDDRRKKLVLDSEYYQKRSDIGLELYIGDITNRYGTFTGNTINSLSIADCTQAVLTTLDEEMRKKPKAKYSAKRDGDRAVFDIVCDLRKQKNGDKFIRLYDKGDFSEYGSQSEADAALCALIAFRTGADPDAIDEVFRSSALYRSKCERDDYRENTINAGISACNGVFHRSKMEHPDFIKFNEQTGEPYVSVPLLAKYVREHLQYILVRDNGKQGLLKYVYEGGCYRLYADNMLLGIIKKYIADYDEELVKMSKVNEVLLHITTDLTYVSQDALNADEDIINFQNGILKITATDTTFSRYTFHYTTSL